MAENDLGEYYTIPVILSFEGIDKQVNSSLGGVLGKAGKKGGLDFGKNLSEGIKASEADVKRALDNHAKLADKAADATGKLKVAQTGYQELVDKGVTSGKRFESAKQAVEKATRDEARATKIAADALKDYEDAAKRAQGSGEKAGSGFLSGLRGAASGAGSAGSEAASSFAEGFAGSSSLMGLASKGGPIVGTIAAAGLVAGGLLAKNVMAGIEREPARDLIQAQLGLDEASMAKLSTSAAKAYTDNFGESIQSNLSTAKTALQTGLISNADDPGTQKTIENLTAVSQLLGEEIPSTARAAGQLIKTGLADNANQAFDLIVKGEQAGLNISDDWLDTLNEYGTQFRKLGLSGPEAVGLISQALKGGARDSDVAADAIKEFSIRAVDGSKTTMQAYRDLGFSAKDMSERFAEGGPSARAAFAEILTAIGSIKDPLKQSQIAVSLFGTQAEDLGGAFNQMDLSNAVNQLGQVDGAAQAAADTMGDNVAGQFESAKRSIETSLDKVQDKLAQDFGPALEDVANWVSEHEDDITGFFVNLGKAGIEAAKQVVIFAGDVIGAVGETGAAFGDVVGWVLDGMAALEEKFGDPAVAQGLREDADAAHSWGEGLIELKDRIKDSANKMDGWKDNLDDVRDSADEAKDKTKDLGGALKELPKDTKVNLSYTVTDAQGNPVTVPLPPGFGGVPQQTTPPTIGGVPFPGFNPGSGGVGGMGPGGRPTPGRGFLGSFNWDAVAKAESSGNWSDDNSGGHSTSSGAPRGGLQITDGTWKSFGGTEFAPTANLATKEQQIAVAERIAFSGWQGTAPQGLGAWEAITKGMVPGITADSQPTAGAIPVGPSVQGTNPQISMLARIAKERFGLDLTSGKRDWAGTASGKSFHLTGEAGDFSNSSGNSPQQAEFAAWLNQNFGQYLQELIYSDPSVPGVSLNAGGPFDYGAKTMSEHQNHVHVAVKDGMAAAFEQALGGGGVTGLSQSGAVSPGMVNAFGAGYKPGIGTPGYNEYGDPGYYETDPRQIASAQRRVEDTEQAIADADQRILEAKQKRADLEDEINVTAEDRAKADREIADAEKDARRAREDAQWAKDDAAEAQQGKFTAAKDAKKQKGGQGGMGLGDLGGIAGSFLKETFGIDGSFLPDLSSIMPIQMLGAGLNAFAGPIQGLIDGNLGIQQPGWQPGMPVEGLSAGGGGFGAPSIVPPPMPADGTHPGTGAQPGPTIAPNIDMSTTVNGTVGMDPDQFRKQQQRNQQRGVDRLSSFGMGLR